MILYKPPCDRVPDQQYRNLLRRIMEQGKDKKPIHATLSQNQASGHSFARELSGATLEYDLSNGFPLLTCRDLTKLATGGVGELAGFINGARTLEQLVSFGCPEAFWKKWVTPEKCAIFGLPPGDLGGGSYGPALRGFPTNIVDVVREEGKEPQQFNVPFDQLAALHEAMRDFPMSRTLMMTSWIPHLDLGSKEQNFKRDVVVAPCHGTLFHVHLFPELGEMELSCVQRSADVAVGLQFNMVQWCILGLVLATIHGYKFTKMTYFVSSAQIYDIQFPAVEQLIGIEPKPFPTVTMEPATPYVNPWDLRKEDLRISDYNPDPFFVVPTPV